DELESVVSDFVPSLRRLVAQLKGERKSLLLILDDINGLADSIEFANWLKSTVDQIATENQPLSVCILIVGLEERRQSLIKLQPSLARVFEIIEIRPWNDQETSQFYSETFSKTAKVDLAEDALQLMVSFTGGLPVLAHEIGDSVWRVAQTHTIKSDDAFNGIFNAAEIIGRKFLEPQVFQAMRSPRYRSILRKLAHHSLASSFKRKEIREKLTEDEAKVLDNFLNKMKSLGVICADNETAPGNYRFANRLHQLYFRLEGLRAERKYELQ
ncbi:MAG TPA: hypothetical protein VEF04_08895, partial [Blastocatellia bacterium]|nr:hypothetical protein [Blastocatellia bacterium]